MSDIRQQIKDLFNQSSLTAQEKKAVLRDVVRDLWPGLPSWSTLDGAVIEEVQKATIGSGVVLLFREDGIYKTIMAEAGAHYKAAQSPAYTIPGGFINLTETTGSALVAASAAPEDARTGAAREVEEEVQTPAGPLLQVDPARLTPADTKTLSFPTGEKRVVIGLTLELTDTEVATFKAHIAKLTSDPAYKAATAAQTINPASGKPEVSDLAIFPLKDVADGKCNLLHKDQQSLFERVYAAIDTSAHKGLSFIRNSPKSP